MEARSLALHTPDAAPEILFLKYASGFLLENDF